MQRDESIDREIEKIQENLNRLRQKTNQYSISEVRDRFTKGQFLKAIDYLEDYMMCESPELYLMRSYAHHQLGNKDLAQFDFVKALQLKDKMEDIDSLLSCMPKFSEFFGIRLSATGADVTPTFNETNMASISEYLRKTAETEALKHYEKQIEDLEAFPNIDSVKIKNEKIISECNKKIYSPNAIRVSELSLLYEKRSDAHFELKMYSEALFGINKAIECSSKKSSYLFFKLGKIHAALGEGEKAYVAYISALDVEKAISTSDKNKILEARGDACLLWKKQGYAIKDYVGVISSIDKEHVVSSEDQKKEIQNKINNVLLNLKHDDDLRELSNETLFAAISKLEPEDRSMHFRNCLDVNHPLGKYLWEPMSWWDKKVYTPYNIENSFFIKIRKSLGENELQLSKLTNTNEIATKSRLNYATLGFEAMSSGILYLQGGDFDSAIYAFTNAINFGWDTGVCYAHRGYTRTRQKNVNIREALLDYIEAAKYSSTIDMSSGYISTGHQYISKFIGKHTYQFAMEKYLCSSVIKVSDFEGIKTTDIILLIDHITAGYSAITLTEKCIDEKTPLGAFLAEEKEFVKKCKLKLVQNKFDEKMQNPDSKLSQNMKNIYFDKAQELLELEMYDEAFEAFGLSIAHGGIYFCHFNRGKICAIKGNYEGAILEYNKALDIGSTVKVYEYRGDAYFNLHQIGKAISDYKKVVKWQSIDNQSCNEKLKNIFLNCEINTPLTGLTYDDLYSAILLLEPNDCIMAFRNCLKAGDPFNDFLLEQVSWWDKNYGSPCDDESYVLNKICKYLKENDSEFVWPEKTNNSNESINVPNAKQEDAKNKIDIPGRSVTNYIKLSKLEVKSSEKQVSLLDDFVIVSDRDFYQELEDCNNRLKTYPTSAVYECRGDAYWNLGRHCEAIMDYDRAITANSNNVAKEKLKTLLLTLRKKDALNGLDRDFLISAIKKLKPFKEVTVDKQLAKLDITFKEWQPDGVGDDVLVFRKCVYRGNPLGDFFWENMSVAGKLHDSPYNNKKSTIYSLCLYLEENDPHFVWPKIEKKVEIKVETTVSVTTNSVFKQDERQDGDDDNNLNLDLNFHNFNKDKKDKKDYPEVKPFKFS